MSIPIDPARAVGGRLAAGDRVDVLFVGDRAVSIIVADAPVLAVDAWGHGGIGESASPFTVTIVVTARQSQLVAAAVADGNIVGAQDRRGVGSGYRAPAARPCRRSRLHDRPHDRPHDAMSIAEPTIALFLAEQRVEDLHRHPADHGGACVRQIVVEPAVVLDEAYDALVVSDRWPALTLGFVGGARAWSPRRAR